MIELLVEPFTMEYKNALYKVSFVRREGDESFLSVENVASGVVDVFSIKNYGIGSGNEHLRDSIEAHASSRFCRAAINVYEKINGIHELDENTFSC